MTSLPPSFSSGSSWFSGWEPESCRWSSACCFVPLRRFFVPAKDSHWLLLLQGMMGDLWAHRLQQRLTPDWTSPRIAAEPLGSHWTTAAVRRSAWTLIGWGCLWATGCRTSGRSEFHRTPDRLHPLCFLCPPTFDPLCCQRRRRLRLPRYCCLPHYHHRHLQTEMF